MTIQEAARIILKEHGKPLYSNVIAELALESKMVASNAEDPIQSLAQTIEKNIRGGIYNDQKLIFIGQRGRRKIALSEWGTGQEQVGTLEKHTITASKELRVRIPIDLFEKIKLAEQAKVKDTFEDTVTMLLSNGLTSVAEDIKRGLLEQLNKL